MKRRVILAALAVCAGLAFTGLPGAGDHGISAAYAQAAKTSSKVRVREVELRRGGYYSYGVPEGERRSSMALDPNGLLDLQSPAGPFDSGFFFDSGIRPHWWNNAPYPN